MRGWGHFLQTALLDPEVPPLRSFPQGGPDCLFGGQQFAVVRIWPGGQCRRCVVFDDAALVDDQDPVEAACLADIVSDADQRALPPVLSCAGQQFAAL